jgi:hypothetical protein
MKTVPRQESAPDGSHDAPSGTFKMALLVCLICLRARTCLLIKKKRDTAPRGYFFLKGTSCIIAAHA